MAKITAANATQNQSGAPRISPAGYDMPFACLSVRARLMDAAGHVPVNCGRTAASGSLPGEGVLAVAGSWRGSRKERGGTVRAGQ